MTEPLQTTDLASTPRGSERVANKRVPQRRRGRAALEKPRVGRVHLDDLAVERALLEQHARRLDLDHFRHASRLSSTIAA